MIFGGFFMTSYASNDMMCTMEYAPVCAEVEVQCIQAPCPPIQETFWNSCMMKNNSLAKFLHDGECQPKVETPVEKPCTREYAPVCGQPKMPKCAEGMMCMQMMPAPQTYANKCMMENAQAEFIHAGTCESQVEEEEDEVRICTMEYAPVCWVNGQTYGNACSAGKVEIKHEGQCLPVKAETKLSQDVQKVLQRVQNQSNEINFVQVIQRAYERIDTLAAKQEMFSLRQTAYLRIKSLFREYVEKNIFTPFIQKNIATISPVEAVLWGKWYVVDVEWDYKWVAHISYEDGHIAEKISGKVELENGKLVFKLYE